jgi:hypothetical protein
VTGYARMGDPPPVGSKSGEGHDRCPLDGCLEVDAFYTVGGQDGHGNSQYDEWGFSADPRRGGCGAAWTRATAQGAARRAARGGETKYLTQTADRGRVYSVPSEAFRARYAAIFGHS